MCPPHLYLNRHGNVISRVVPASSDLTQPKAALQGDVTYHPNYLTTAKMAKTYKRNFGLSNTVHHILYQALKCPVKPFCLLALCNTLCFNVPVSQMMENNFRNVKVIDSIFRRRGWYNVYCECILCHFMWTHLSNVQKYKYKQNTNTFPHPTKGVQLLF